MKIHVLGSAAGGGFPQWNCNCRNCAGLRALTRPPARDVAVEVPGEAPDDPSPTGDVIRKAAGDPSGAAHPPNAPSRWSARTQSSIAVTGSDRSAAVLVNASPDILTQLQRTPDLQPNRAVRDSAIEAIMLVDGQVDHTTGLYMLREAVRPWPLWCTDSTFADLTQGNPVLRVLAHFCGVDRRRIELDRQFSVDAVEHVLWRALPVASKPAPYSPNRDAPVSGDNLALVISDAISGQSAVYAPGLAAIDERLWDAMQGAACVLVDGTFWTDDEMIRQGVSAKRAREIGHLPQSGPDGMLAWLDQLPTRTRKILIHINNTNPILDETSAEAALLRRHGVEVAHDGMEILL